MNLKNKNILLVGLAKTGVSTIKLLNKLEANIIVNDIKDKEKLKDIANFINNLKEPDKTYFYLKYFINMESKEIAKKYNTTLSSVENRLYRCRLALKKIIDGGV